jgi:alpha-glucosidase
MRKYFTALLSFLSVATTYAYQLDTNKNELHISHKDEVVFRIPLSTINLELPKSKFSSKLGSVKFDLKEKDKHEICVTSFTTERVQFSDGAFIGEVSVDLNGILTLQSSSNVFSFSFINAANERFFGGGSRFSSPVLNNQKVVTICEENGIGRGDKPISKWTALVGARGEEYATYYPLPFIWSTANRGLHIAPPNSFSLIEIQESMTHVMVSGQTASIQLYCVENEMSIVQAFNLANGRGQSIPKWALGSIVGVQGGTQEVSDKLAPLLEKKVRIDAIWIQDWVGKRQTSIGSRLNWQWQLDSSYTGIFEYASTHNMKVLGYINPFFAETGSYTLQGIERGYFVQENNAPREFDFGGMKGYMLDIFNPNAQAWMKEIITINLVENGFSGWMADFAEWYPVENMNDILAHNQYTHEWVKLNHEVRMASGQELFIFHRSGSSSTAHYSQATWCGDQLTTYGENDGLPSSINAMVSGGMSGLPPTHSDIGGYTSVKKPILKKILRTQELMKDWIILEAFTPFFRSHEGLLPEQDLQIYDATIIDHYAVYATANRLLQDYFYDLIEHYHATGEPLISYPTVHCDTCPEYGFYVGNDIYIVYDNTSQWTPEAFVSLNLPGASKIEVYVRKDAKIRSQLNF